MPLCFIGWPAIWLTSTDTPAGRWCRSAGDPSAASAVAALVHAMRETETVAVVPRGPPQGGDQLVAWCTSAARFYITKLTANIVPQSTTFICFQLRVLFVFRKISAKTQ